MTCHALAKVSSPGGGNGDTQKRMSCFPEAPPAPRSQKRTGFSSVTLATMQFDWLRFSHRDQITDWCNVPVGRAPGGLR
jgi:hypothetical protein